jgi:hypothetical protein
MQALPLIGLGLKVGGSVFKGIAANNAGKFNQKVDEANATNALREGTAQVQRIRDASRLALGRQFGAQAESGFEVGTGSAIDSLMESATNAELDAMDARRQAQSRYSAYMLQGQQERRAGKNALIGGLIGAAGSLVAGVQDYASAARSGG